jgi:VWFA-related protein
VNTRISALALAAALLGTGWFGLLASAENPVAPSRKITTSTDPDAPPVFRTSTRMVLVDVIATDKNGAFVSNLKPADFAILEDGKAQKLSSFTSYTSSSTSPPPLTVKLPAHQYSNFSFQPGARPVTIILLDTLNASTIDQNYGRQHMIEFLQKLPPGERVALFTLGANLRMIQGFTGDSNALVAAAQAMLAKKSPHLVTEADREEQEATTDAMTTSMDARSAAAVREALEREFSEEESMRGTRRLLGTLDALKALARAVNGYPGRKTLLWLSADFPLRIGPDFARYGVESFTKDYSAEIRETQALLATAQVAVFPIDVRGLATVGFEASSPYGTTPATITRESEEMYDSHGTMNDIAKETGGEAFYNRNDIQGAMSRAVAGNTSYYTLGYVPEDREWDGKYRVIQIKSSSPGVHLSYRRGYFALQQKEFSDDDSFQMFEAALKPSMPDYTMLLVRVQVLPPDETHKSIRIDYAVDAHDVRFTDPGDHHEHAVLDFMAVAWDKSNQEAGHFGKTVRAALPAKSYQQVMKTGIPLHQELELKPGAYDLRLGVIDRGSQRIGTLDVPITVTEGKGGTK